MKFGVSNVILISRKTLHERTAIASSTATTQVSSCYFRFCAMEFRFLPILPSLTGKIGISVVIKYAKAIILVALYLD